MNDRYEPFYIPADDVDMYGVADEGWYAIDEDYQVVDGPFTDRKECLHAIENKVWPNAA